MSLIDLANALELWLNNEMLNPHFQAFFYDTRTTPFTTQEFPAYWAAVRNFAYGARSPSYTYIRDPVHRLIHRLIAFSITGRREGPRKAHLPDLLFLGSIIRGESVNIPHFLALWMCTRARGTRVSSSICGGYYVNKIARYLGVNQDVFQHCTLILLGMSLLGIRQLTDMGIIQTSAHFGLPGAGAFWVTPLGAGQKPPA